MNPAKRDLILGLAFIALALWCISGVVSQAH
jgi:hypothetical protein